MGTILVSEVDQPHLYGVVVHDSETKQISEFKEKPKEFVGNHINAGITMLDLRLIRYLELKRISIGIFPVTPRKTSLPGLVSEKVAFLLPFEGTVEGFGAAAHVHSRLAGLSRAHRSNDGEPEFRV